MHIVIAGKGDEIAEAAEVIAAGLDASGVRVLLDDRIASVGVKFTDAELIGVPTICVVGRGVAKGVVEVRDRATGAQQELSIAEIVERLRRDRPRRKMMRPESIERGSEMTQNLVGEESGLAGERDGASARRRPPASTWPAARRRRTARAARNRVARRRRSTR